ncbi:MAG: undecaprenyldiphospho-muramoylpentapeptide beta-N-acetylglucosaminyltransferase [Oscillospiraceae bacterium]|nr:undecaprenyldiphospho-muramoylpentapeptide beta-N-acetylglucosaminyltransferase [Oscillospiraceae bacterium]
MNVIFTCGGTGGHINPAIAVANIWRERHPDSNILFIGAKGRMEEELVPKAGFRLATIDTNGMTRGLSLGAIKHNIRAVGNILRSVERCKVIIQDFKPDVVVGTGGYASFPALTAAVKLGIPTCVHEANAVPGLTTKLVAKRANVVLTCFEESARYYKNAKKVETVGMPVRSEFIYTKKEDARKELGLDNRPLVVSAFGSQGARAMNEAMGRLFRLEQDAGFPFRHIHAIGSYGMSWMPDYMKAQGVDPANAEGIELREYIYNMPTVMAAADVFISRAGASTCNEIAASGTPCILIPSPNVTNNHQEKNARVLADNGAAVLILEEDCTAERLMEELLELTEDKARCTAMTKALQKMSVPDSAQRVCDIMEDLAHSK